MSKSAKFLAVPFTSMLICGYSNFLQTRFYCSSSHDDALKFSDYTSYIFPPIYSSSPNASSNLRSNVESDSEDSEIEDSEFRKPIHLQLFSVLSSITRNTIYNHSFQLSLPTVSAGVLGAIGGSMLKHRFSTLVMVSGAYLMLIRAGVDYELITIHWDRIRQYELYRILENTWEKVGKSGFWKIPLVGVFCAGFMVGFKFG